MCIGITAHELSLPTGRRTGGTFRFDRVLYDGAADVLHLEVGPLCAVVKERTPDGDLLEISAPDERIVAIRFVRARERLRSGGSLTAPTGEGFALGVDPEEISRILDGGRFARPSAVLGPAPLAGPAQA